MYRGCAFTGDGSLHKHFNVYTPTLLESVVTWGSKEHPIRGHRNSVLQRESVLGCKEYKKPIYT